MSDAPPPLPRSLPRTYRQTDVAHWGTIGCLAGGAALGCVNLLSVVLLFAAPHASPALPGIIGGSCVPTIFLLITGLGYLRDPRFVTVTADGVIVGGLRSPRSIAWSMIDAVRKTKRSQLLGSSHEALVLLDAQGRTLARIVDRLDDFAELEQELVGRSSAARGSATTEAAGQQQFDETKARRAQRRIFALGFVLFLMTGAATAGTAYFYLHERRYATDGLTVQADVVEYHMNKVTPYVQYAFTDADGRRHSNDVMMLTKEWLALSMAHASKVEVVYVPDAPEWNRLTHGQDETEMGLEILIGGAAVTLFSIGVMAMAVIGIDLRMEKRRIVLTRHGKVLWQSQQPLS